MKASLKKNYFYNLIYQICILLPPLITTPYLSRVLGAEGIGIYSFTSSILSYFVLFGSLGISLYGQREIAANQNKIESRSKIFKELFILKLIFILFSFLIFAIIYFNNKQYSIYYKILGIELLVHVIDITWFYQGLENFKKITTQNLIVKILSTVSIFLFVKNGNMLLIYFLIMFLSTFISYCLLWIGLKKWIVKVPLKQLQIKKHLKNTFFLFLPQIAIQVYTVLDKTMIGWILADMKEVGYYEQSQKLVKICLMVITSLGTVMIPRISNLHAENKEDELNKKITKSFQVVSFIAFPMCLGLIAISTKLVPWFFGEEFLPIISLISVLSFLFLAIGFNNITGIQYAIPTNNQKIFTISVIIGAVSNFILNLILIPIFESIGAAIASVFAETIIFIIQIIFFRNKFNFKNIFQSNIHYFYYSIIVFLVAFLIGNIFEAGIVATIVQTICGFCTYILLLVICKDSLFKEIISGLKYRVGDINERKSKKNIKKVS